ncbi:MULTISPECIES: hypothetical protein [Amniculibacterium]|uniref:hypothetical protein n=1 Tax=Amniculibacterium TaxID=2715289 RepID=UPI000F5AEDFB|nr:MULTISPECIES: hypothetical protein [Amniculibacterium]
MKKLLLLGAFALFGSMNAQSGFKLGAHVGLPVGDAGDVYSFTLGADASYMWPVADSFSAGITSGYSAWLGKTVNYGPVSVKYDTMSMVPIAATGQYKIAENFSLAADLGYGFVFGSGGSSDGGFYYQPKAAYHIGNGEVSLGYQGLSKNGSTISAINLGYSYYIK